LENAASTSSQCAASLDPQIAITIVAIMGAFSHLIVAVLRGLQDYRHNVPGHQTRVSDSPG
jgi:hypothetical protein